MFLPRILAVGRIQSKIPSLSKSAALGSARFRLDQPRFASKLGGPDDAPLVFKKLKVGSVDMKVTKVGNKGPFFLDNSQLRNLKDFISLPPSKLFVFSGTVKSGKSALLNSVLPGLVMAHHKNSKNKRTPVFFKYEILDKRGPDAALLELCVEIRSVASSFGIQLTSEPGTTAQTLFRLFAQELTKQGKELWVLLDEVQQPLLYCSPEQQEMYGIVLKAIFDQCVAGGARVAMAGSGMLGLLINLRHAPTQGTFLWGMTTILSRGQSYDTSTFTEMIKILLKFYNSKLSPDLRVFVTPELVLNTFLGHKDWVNFRPGLLGHFFWLLYIFGKDFSVPAAAFNHCWQMVLSKLQEESNLPTATALDSLSLRHRLLLRQLAHQELTHDKLQELDCETLQIVGSLLDSDAPTLELQPPYGTLFKQWILPDGKLCLKIVEHRVRLFPVAEYNLVFMVDMSAHTIFPGHEKAISSAVEKVLFEFCNLAKSSSDSDVRKQVMESPPVKETLKALHENSRRTGKYSVKVGNEIFSKSAHDFENLSDLHFKDVWGYKFLFVLRHIHQHHMFDPNVWMSVPHSLVEKLVAAAANTLTSSHKGFCTTDRGYLYEAELPV